MTYTHPPGQQLQSEFRMIGGGFARMVTPFVFVLLLGGVLFYVFGYAIGGGSNLGGWIGAVGGTAVLVGILYFKFARMKNGTVVRFSDWGVELSDAMGFRIRLRWPDVTRLGSVHTQLANPKKIGGDLQVSVGAMKTLGLIGWGERITPKRIPGWMRDQLSRVPTNPADGRPEVAIPLGGIDPEWVRGAMGVWVRHFRPDLLGGGQQPAPPPQQPGYPGYPPQQFGYPPQPPGYPQQGPPYR